MNRIRIALIATLLSAAVLSAAQNPLRDFLVARDRAIGLLPARAVGGPGVKSLSWSSDGRYLVMVCSGNPSYGDLPGATLTLARFRRLSALEETWISLYDLQTGKTETLWTGPSKTFSLGEPKWLAGTNRAYVVAKIEGKDEDGLPTHLTKVFEVAAEDGQIHEFFSVPESKTEPLVQILPSPTRPIGVMSVFNRDTTVQAKPLVLFLIGDLPTGPKSLSLAKDADDLEIGWTLDGGHAMAIHRTVAGPDGAPYPKLILDFEHGTTVESATARAFAEDESKKPFRAEVAPNGVLWVTAMEGKSGAIVAHDAESVSLSTKAVAYVSQGVALVRPMLSMPVRDYFGLREAVEEPLAESRAKKCYFCLLSYAKAHSDQLPDTTDDIATLLKPYDEDAQDFEGFAYQHGGGPRASISNPKNTLLGSVVTVTGKVYLYADGNIRWESNGLGNPGEAD